MAGGLSVYPVETLSDAVDLLNDEISPEPFALDVDEVFAQSMVYALDFKDVKGQDHVKRALEVAASGGHNIIRRGRFSYYRLKGEEK